ncbi:MAG TPA: hypothetical protein VGL71_05590, partial [Urbifossiella sp.]
MSDTSLFFSMRPAYPWSVYPIGMPALAIVAVLLIGFTLWTYLGHPQATRKRVVAVLVLRMLALAVALITAVRPSVGLQEEPKIPSLLLIGVDLSESMSVKDEVNNQARIDAVRRTLDKCQPTLDDLANDQNIQIKIYGFSTSDFNADTSLYDPKAPADGKRSDYGTYLNRTFEKWQGERFIRGHLLIGDGADNGTAFAAIGEAGRWGKRSWPITTFTVGQQDTTGAARDLQVASVLCDPSPVPIKNDLTVVARVNAYGFKDSLVKARVFFNDEPVWTEDVNLTKEKDNEVRIPVKAPEKPGEIKVRVEIGREEAGKIVPLPGEVTAVNNHSETYLTVNKEGVRVLIIDRLRWEETRLRDALRIEKRFDVYEVIRQTSLPGTADEKQWLNLDEQAYDVVIIGNVSFEQLKTALPDGSLPEKLLDRVTNKGMGIMFLGGEAAFTGYPDPPPGDPEKRPLAFADLLPVIPAPTGIHEEVNGATRQPITFQTVPTAKGIDDHVLKIDRDEAKAKQLWDELNGVSDGRKFRITGYNQFAKKGFATTYAFASSENNAIPAGRIPPAKVDPLLVGAQIGAGNKGRILAFGAYDTYLWERLGQPQSQQGVEIHNRFWKQCVLWLAHQEDEEGQVYARPEFRRLAVGGDQTIWVGLKSPAGGDDPGAELDVKILPPGQDRPEDEAKAPKQTVLKTTKDGKPATKVLFKPSAPGEYTVVISAPMKGPDGKPMIGPDGKPQRYRGSARFIAFPDVSDEMLRIGAVPEFMEKIAGASGGKALHLEDLPDFLKELKAQKLDTLKP